MATVDLGKISFTQKGTYDNSTSYAPKDVVQYTDQNETSSYVKINSTATGQVPETNGTINSSHWAIFAKGASIASGNQGTYDASTTYDKGDVVQFTDTGVLSTFLYINNTPASGQTPSTSGTVNTSHWQLLAKGTASVALAWANSITTASTLTAVAGNGYWIDTNANACTVTFPSTASIGDEIILVDVRRNWATNAVTINPNGLNFQGATTPQPVYDVSGQSVRCVYSGATYGWIPLFDSSVVYETKQPYTITYLCVGGGGGGGCDSNDPSSNNSSGGGGGAGGFRTGSYTAPANTTYTLTIGTGGAGGVANNFAPNGTASSIAGSGLTTISSAGGGGGGGEAHQGQAGGSGGGGGYGNDGPIGQGGAGNTPSTSPSQGNPGGTASSNDYAGGGGGAGEAGNTDQNGAGGDGSSSSITGSAVFYAGGGAAGKQSGQPDNPAGDGGGAGPGDTSGGENKTAPANLGGGGCGSGNQGTLGKPGGIGGTGVVILSVATSNYSGVTTGNPVITTSGSNTIMKFTGTGTYVS